MKDWSTVPLEKRKKLFKKARKIYYNSQGKKNLMSDEEFDALEDSIVDDDPKWSELKKTGAPVEKKKKVKLEYFMPSLGKKTPKDAQDFLNSNQATRIAISEKLDGTSLQVGYDKGQPVYCYTRGQADPTKDTHSQEGGDISYVLHHLKIPQKIAYKKHMVLRCEGIFTKQAFQKYSKESIGDEGFDNARNAASGILNRSSDKTHSAIKDLRVVVVKMLSPWVEPSKGLRAAKKMGFKVVAFKSVPAKKVTVDKLVKLYEKRKKKSKYHMDGLVLSWDKVNPKYTSDKPKWEIAFKVPQGLDEAPTATVKSIFWKTSSFGVLVPKAILEPTMFEGVTVKQATLNNARWMIDRKIGPGARVKLIRGGEIIPKIIGVVKPGKIQLPEKSEFGKYTWDENKTHLVLVDKDKSEDVQIRNIVRFFSKMKVEFMKEKTIRKLYNSGINTIKKMLTVTPDQLLEIEGVKEKSANKFYNEIQRFLSEGAFLPKLMEGSGVFQKGMGAKRIVQIQKTYGDVLAFAEYSRDEIREKLDTVPMFGGSSTEAFIEGIYKFKKWFDKQGIKIKKPEKVKKASNKLNGIQVTWTGYRSRDEEEVVTKNGGEIVSFGGSTQVLLISPAGKTSSKPEKARARGIDVMTWEQFEKKYL